jgi:hypothetical protein
MQAQTPPYASEVILYRTRTDILSDLRFIVNGQTYPLSKVQSARVVSAWYYWPLQALRGLMLAAALAVVLSLIGVISASLLPDNLLIRVGIAALLAASAYGVTQVIPTHRIRFKMDNRSISVMLSHDKEDLKAIAAKINQAAARLQKPAGN